MLILAMSATALVGCGNQDNPPVDPNDPNAIKKVFISGTMNKKNYAWDDEWDISGLIVKGTTNAGDTSVLPSDKYTLTFSKPKPKNYTTSLMISARLKADDTKSGSITFKDIHVDDEIYDNAAEVSAYYKDCNLTYTGSTLMNELHRHSFAKHTYFVKYGETQAYLSKSKKDGTFDAPDIVPNAHKIEMFYTNNQTNYNIGAREHVWPCADSAGLWPHGKVDESTYIGGGSDLYHIRPCTSTVNTARGDAPYVDFDDPQYSSKKSSTVDIGDDGPYKLKIYGADQPSPGVYEFADLVEPADEVKGDIARIIAYVYMHYATNSKTPSKYKYMTGSLNLTSVIDFSTVSKAKTVLKQWNELDPVSEVELHRNHTVGQIQGNRNPFVDYPDLINKVF